MEIKSVVLQSNSIMEMKKFYVDNLGFSLIKEDQSSFCIAVGSSILEFTSNHVEGNPYYHFAFNIPSNQFKEAKSWVKERVQLNVEEGEDEADFTHFPAYAIYFNDPSGNIVEFISRYSISEKSTEPFSANSIINISEIGLTVDDAINAGEKLVAIGLTERDNYPISSTSLNFMGDKPKGIFVLLTQPGRRWIFSDKLSAIYPLKVTLTNNNKIIINSDNVLEVYTNGK